MKHNPFVWDRPLQPQDGPIVMARDSLVERAVARLRRGEVCGYVGSPGTGKSTFLNCVEAAARADGRRPVVVLRCEGLCTEVEVAAAYRAAAAPIAEVPGGAPLGEVLRVLHEAAPGVAHLLHDPDLLPHGVLVRFVELVRAAQQASAEASITYTACHDLRGVQGRLSPLPGTRTPLKDFAEPQIAQWLAMLAASGCTAVGPALAPAVYALAEGHPMLTQHLLHRAVAAAEDAGEPHVTPAHVERAGSEVLDDLYGVVAPLARALRDAITEEPEIEALLRRVVDDPAGEHRDHLTAPGVERAEKYGFLKRTADGLLAPRNRIVAATVRRVLEGTLAASGAHAIPAANGGGTAARRAAANDALRAHLTTGAAARRLMAALCGEAAADERVARWQAHLRAFFTEADSRRIRASIDAVAFLWETAGMGVLAGFFAGLSELERRQSGFAGLRDHVGHTMFVYLTGLYLLDHVPVLRAALRAQAAADLAHLGLPAGEDEADVCVQRRWMVAATFHDIGYLFELEDDASRSRYLERVREFWNRFPHHVAELERRRNPRVQPLTEADASWLVELVEPPPLRATLEQLDEIARVGSWDLFALLDRASRDEVVGMGPDKTVRNYWDLTRTVNTRDGRRFTDHGIVSALLLLRFGMLARIWWMRLHDHWAAHHPGIERLARVGLDRAMLGWRDEFFLTHVPAASAIALHNVYVDLHDAEVLRQCGFTMDRYRIRQENNALAYLLTLVDVIQHWDRPYMRKVQVEMRSDQIALRAVPEEGGGRVEVLAWRDPGGTELNMEGLTGMWKVLRLVLDRPEQVLMPPRV
jgi:hypothetical protein